MFISKELMSTICWPLKNDSACTGQAELSYALFYLHYEGYIEVGVCCFQLLFNCWLSSSFHPVKSNLLVTVQSRVQYMLLPRQIKRGVEMTIAVNSPCFYTLAVCQYVQSSPWCSTLIPPKVPKNTKKHKTSTSSFHFLAKQMMIHFWTSRRLRLLCVVMVLYRTKKERKSIKISGASRRDNV